LISPKKAEPFKRWLAKVGYEPGLVKDRLCASKKHLSPTINKNPYQKPKVAEDVK